MANIYDMNAALQTPDIVGNFNKGVQIGQQNQVYGQKQAAYQQALGDQQNIRALAPGILAGDPSAYSQAAAIDPDQADKYQGAANGQLTRIQGALNYLDQQQTPQAKEAAYQQAVKPFLAALAQANGHTVPDSYAAAQPGLDAMRAKISALGQQKSDLINVGAGGAVFDPKTRQAVYTNPGAGPKPQLIQTDKGYAYATPGAPVQPVVYGGDSSASQHLSDPMTPFIAQANDAIKMGAPEEQVKAWLMQKAAAMGGQPIAPADQSPEAQNQAMQAPVMGQQGIQPGAPVMGPQKATAEDKETFGAPQMVIGTDGKQHLVQFGNRGGQKEVSGYAKPEMTPAQAAKQAVQQQKAESSKTDALDSYDQSITQIDKLLNSPGASMLGTFSGDFAGMIPHSDTANANAALDNIKNQVLLNTISKLKSLSATGASGFGSLSNQEGEILKNSIASLDKKQSNAQLIENLKNIKNMLERSRNVIAGKQVEFDSGQGQENGQQVAQQSGPAQTPSAQPMQPSQSQPRAVNSMGHAVVWNGSAWVPE